MMKKFNNKKIILIFSVALLCICGFYVAGRVSAENEADIDPNTNKNASEIGKSDGTVALAPIGKDETVYVNLNSDGTVSQMNVVNHFLSQETGIYRDYGKYENVINLTNEVIPDLGEDFVEWEINNSSEDFYYQGQLQNGELPWNFKIDYQLEGRAVKAEDLAGAVGKLVITLSTEENKKADAYFRDNYMMQITVGLNMQTAKLLSAPGAVVMVAGHTKTLAFTCLPKAANTFVITAEVEDFEMESIDIAMMKAELSAYLDVEEMTTGFESLSGGMEELTDGTGQLKDGLSELSGGLTSLAEGLNQVSNGTPQLSEGMKQYQAGLDRFAKGLTSLETGSGQMKAGLQDFTGNGEQLLSGYQEIDAGFASLLSMKEEILAAANGMILSSDPQMVILGQSILAQMEGLDHLKSGLNTLNNNLELYVKGIEQASGQYQALDAGIAALPDGFTELSKGYLGLLEGNETIYSAVNELSKGLTDISTATADIPDQIEQLAVGQAAIKDGIDRAGNEIKEMAGAVSQPGVSQPVSFAAPGKAIPNSVQFVLRTPAIKTVSEQSETILKDEAKESFWDKLIELFR
ncbi:MAG: hypothetical protein K0S76_2917 [Herbinix sp.]|jgi:X-X-X-Leu-X-X-Gly heptad repeat protein|nr:hypothetical protein [Herbinix sp.]